MFMIEEGVIYLTRGDYAEIEIAITDSGGAPYTMAEGDVLTFSVRETPSDESTLQFSVQSLTNRLIINHADTADMEPGNYSADVQLTDAAGRRRTVWGHVDERAGRRGRTVWGHVDERAGRRGRTGNWKNFVLMPEVTMT